MKISSSLIHDARPKTRAGQSIGRVRGSRSSQEGGFTVLVVFILLVIMASVAIGNNLALHHLEQELQLIERRQQQHLNPSSRTNAPVHPAPRAPSSQPGKTAAVVRPDPAQGSGL